MSKLKVQNISYRIGSQTILKDVSFSCEKGETCGIYGKSGSGKSTLFHLLAGFSEDYLGEVSGSISYDGKNIFQMTPTERVKHVTLMFQNVDTQFCMDTVENELIFCLENLMTSVAEILPKVMDALEFCGITHLKERQLHTLSGGEKQLVALSCCYCLESDFLLLDEPFANLDEESTKVVIQKLQKLQKKRQLGIIFIDHQVDPLKEWVPTWNRFKDGKLTETVTATAILQQEKTIRQKSSSFKRAAEETPRLRLENLVIQQEKPLLQQAELVFPIGQLIGISGKSGSGKTSLLEALGKSAKYQGSILLDQQEIRKIGRRKFFQETSYIFQNPQDQFIAATVEKELRSAAKKTAHELDVLLQQLHLSAAKSRSPFLLSQGQQRRLAVAELLLRPLKLLLCDEPTYGQDLENAMFIMEMIKTKVRKEKMTAIVVSHDQKLLAQYCDQHYHLQDRQLRKVEQHEKT